MLINNILEAAVRSREEDEELERSTKKVKENHSQGVNSRPASPRTNGSGGGFSYKEKLVGEIPGAFEQAFAFANDMELEAESDDESADLEVGIAVVNLSGERKASIRGHWSNALIVKVVGKMVGYQVMSTRLLNLWKPSGRMDCIDLGEGFFLIRFSAKEDYGKALKDGPWFVSGHYLSMRNWEPNFNPSKANVATIAVWVRLPNLPIEYYEPSVLRDIGKAIGPVLRIDTHTATETRGRFARLCIQISYDRPLIKLIKVGGISQPVHYEGLSSLCFSCGCAGHREENCPY